MFVVVEHFRLCVDGAASQPVQQHNEPQHNQLVVSKRWWGRSTNEGHGAVRQAQRCAQASRHRGQESRHHQGERAHELAENSEHACSTLSARCATPR